jgi:hypothetical protein
MTRIASVVVHPNTRRSYADERLRKAAELLIAERAKFLEEALAKYRVWATGLGAPPHKVSADIAALRCVFFPSPQRRQA